MLSLFDKPPTLTPHKQRAKMAKNLAHRTPPNRRLAWGEATTIYVFTLNTPHTTQEP